MLKTKVWVWTLGLLFTQAFLTCVIRDLVSPLSPSMRRLLEVFLPGFNWHSPAGFLVGLAESFLWGVYAALVLVPMLNVFLLKHHAWRDLYAGSERAQHHRAAA